jgi:hypothetical protein
MTFGLHYSLRRQIETGITNYHSLHWIEHRPKCILSKEFEPVDMAQLSTALIALTWAIVFCFGILILEILLHRFLDKNRLNLKQLLKQTFDRFMQ